MNIKTSRIFSFLITPFIAAFVLGWVTVGFIHAQTMPNQAKTFFTDKRKILLPTLAPNATYVSGVITQSTTWTAVNSPYVVNGNLTVAIRCHPHR